MNESYFSDFRCYPDCSIKMKKVFALFSLGIHLKFTRRPRSASSRMDGWVKQSVLLLQSYFKDVIHHVRVYLFIYVLFNRLQHSYEFRSWYQDRKDMSFKNTVCRFSFSFSSVQYDSIWGKLEPISKLIFTSSSQVHRWHIKFWI